MVKENGACYEGFYMTTERGAENRQFIGRFLILLMASSGVQRPMKEIKVTMSTRLYFER